MSFVSKLLEDEINGIKWKRRVSISLSKRVKLHISESSLSEDQFISLHQSPPLLCLPPYLNLHHFYLLNHPPLCHFFPLTGIVLFSFSATTWMTPLCSELECPVSGIQNARRAIITWSSGVQSGRWAKDGRWGSFRESTNEFLNFKRFFKI